MGDEPDGLDVEHIYVDGVRWDLADPASVTPTPDREAALQDPDAAAAAATVVTPSASVLQALETLLPERYTDTGLIVRWWRRRS